MGSADVDGEPGRWGGGVVIDGMRNGPTMQERVATKRERGGPASDET